MKVQIAIVAASLLCVAGSPLNAQDASPQPAPIDELGESEVDPASSLFACSCTTTETHNYTVTGSGLGLQIYEGSVLLGDEVHITMGTPLPDCVKLNFTRTSAPLLYFNVSPTTHLCAKTPTSGSANTVSGTFDIEPSTGSVDTVWPADNYTPTRPIPIVIRPP